MIDETGTATERVGFCQDCGKPLTRDTARPVGAAMFCEPCLQVRLAATQPGAPQTAPAGTSDWTSTATPPPNAGAPFSSVPPGTMPIGTMPPLGGDNPNPVLAGFLGLIPGVGAFYNGQFGKGIAHLVIFFLLGSMEHVSGFFSLLTFLWCLYQSYEAYHTARARREGRPLPDPLGLNDIADRVGFATHFRGPSRGAPSTPTPPFTTPYAASGPQPAKPEAATTAYPPPSFVTPPPFQAAPQAAATWAGEPVAPAAAYEPVAGGYAPYPYAAPYIPVPVVPVAPTGLARFPSMAVWLIGLALVFLLLQVDSARWSVAHTVPFLLAALAVWVFVRRMATTGGVMPTESEESGLDHPYPARLAHQLPFPGMLLVFSVLLALDNFHLARWDKTWPVLLIALGAFLLLERLARRPAVVPGSPAPGDTQKGGR